LNAILNELPHKSGELSISGRVTYVSQIPWVFSGTIKENILFGEKFCEERYQAVIAACALEEVGYEIGGKSNPCHFCTNVCFQIRFSILAQNHRHTVKCKLLFFTGIISTLSQPPFASRFT